MNVKAYFALLEVFRNYCITYSSHEVYYINRVNDICISLPKFNKLTVKYDKDKLCFTFNADTFKQHISEDLFGLFDIYKDPTFTGFKNVLDDLYKPGLFEAYRNNGNTLHATEMNNICTLLFNKLHEYKLNFKLTHKGNTNEF